MVYVRVPSHPWTGSSFICNVTESSCRLQSRQWARYADAMNEKRDLVDVARMYVAQNRRCSPQVRESGWPVSRMLVQLPAMTPLYLKPMPANSRCPKTAKYC